jgi:deoxycytidylate deaminase
LLIFDFTTLCFTRVDPARSDAYPTRVAGIPPQTEGKRVSKGQPDVPEERDTDTADVASQAYYPELILCLCAAVGTDTKEVTAAFASELKAVGYTPVPIRLSQLMPQIPGLESLADLTEEDRRIRMSMRAGNEIRRVVKSADAVIRLALPEIQKCRRTLNGDPDVQAERHCFIISSLKREEELETLRRLYGQRVLLASIYEPREVRCENLCRNIARSKRSAKPEDHRETADELIAIDQKEKSDRFGQRLEDVFQKADVFLKAGISLRTEIRRFIQLLFRAPFIAPTIDEILIFHARATSQRSADLSRQVGAVIATGTGEILATGCNEVPRAGGGVNWDSVAGTNRDYRDYNVGQDSAAGTRKEIVAEILDELAKAEWLTQEKAGLPSEQRAHEALFGDSKPLSGTAVASLLEFGRIVHAEMAAICDAAMRGVGVQGATLYCTTFPCHMCARLIMAAGICRVVYIQPYPKSRAKMLYKRAIKVDEDREADQDAVKFEAFVGVAPSRFLDLFDMVARKDEQGYALSSVAPSGAPKSVTSGSLATELESSYIASINADWSQLKLNEDNDPPGIRRTVELDEGG